jgi:hypothetical protein
MNWLRDKLRKWLGIARNLELIRYNEQAIRTNEKEIAYNQVVTKNLASIGVDVHFKEPHMILIYSKLNGGQLRHISAEFKDLQELNQFVKELKFRYNTDKVTLDAHYSMRNMWNL